MGQLSPNTRAVCSDNIGHDGLAPTAAERDAGLVVCAYVDAIGKLNLPVTFPFDENYRLDRLRYGFANGRLVQIAAEISLDGYDALVRDFTQRYGPSVRLVRDTVKSEIGALPRVTQAWSAPEGSIEIVDPVLPEDEIGVRFAAGPRSSAAPIPATARR
ncbi:hypothetical protein [Phenylobacterium sp.]|uniref:hypothetical protein n=1 Tax=Phenylobacterium sp. TaxID=1871053 RepID=UPI001212C5CE|nr:hypothetical protein [Phenylobacterium sp.]THD61537.1 MAG: hypothetical protein E8A49_11190 [Phenylobacterium sp.]